MAASCFLLGTLFGSLREEHGWAPQVLDFTLPGSGEVHGLPLRNSRSRCANAEELSGHPRVATPLQMESQSFAFRLSGRVVLALSKSRFMGMAGAGCVTLRLTSSDEEVR